MKKPTRAAYKESLMKGGMTEEQANKWMKGDGAGHYEPDGDEGDDEGADMESIAKSLQAIANKDAKIGSLRAELASLHADNADLLKSLEGADAVVQRLDALNGRFAEGLEALLIKSMATFESIEADNKRNALALLTLTERLDNLTKSLGAPAAPRSVGALTVVHPQGQGHSAPAPDDRAQVGTLLKSLGDRAAESRNFSEVKRLANLEIALRDGLKTPAQIRLEAAPV